MKLNSLSRSLCFLIVSFSFLFTACSTPPVLKMSKDLPDIVKKYKHLTIHEWVSGQIDTGIHLEKGDFLSILADSYHERFYLSVSIGENGHYIMGNPWSKLLHDYNLLRGRLWLFVLIWTTIAPYIMFKLRNA